MERLKINLTAFLFGYLGTSIFFVELTPVKMYKDLLISFVFVTVLLCVQVGEHVYKINNKNKQI